MTNTPSADATPFRESLLRLLAATPKDEDRLLAGFERRKATGETRAATWPVTACS